MTGGRVGEWDRIEEVWRYVSEYSDVHLMYVFYVLGIIYLL